jgi:hypothetical protein
MGGFETLAADLLLILDTQQDQLLVMKFAEI